MDRQGSLLQLKNKQTANYPEPNLGYLKTFEVGDTVETMGVLYGIENSDRGPRLTGSVLSISRIGDSKIINGNSCKLLTVFHLAMVVV